MTTLVTNDGAISCAVVGPDGKVARLFGVAPTTEVLLIPSLQVLARGPVSARSASGEIVVIAALGADGFVLVTVFPERVPESSARAAVASALGIRRETDVN